MRYQIWIFNIDIIKHLVESSSRWRNLHNVALENSWNFFMLYSLLIYLPIHIQPICRWLTRHESPKLPELWLVIWYGYSFHDGLYYQTRLTGKTQSQSSSLFINNVPKVFKTLPEMYHEPFKIKYDNLAFEHFWAK